MERQGADGGTGRASESKDTSDRNPCPVHPECIHREICVRSLCLLFFQPGVTWDDLKSAIRSWLKHDRLQTLHRAMPKEPYGPREPPTDIDRFVLANRSLFKTPLVYTVMSKVIFVALMGVLDE